MQAKITARLVKSLTPRATPYEIFDTGLTGFLLRVQPSGSMSYYLAYRALDGRGKRFRVGRADALTVAQARDLAEKSMAQVMAGVDVQEARQHERNEAQRAQFQTLGGFLDAKYAPWVLASANPVQQRSHVCGITLPICWSALCRRLAPG